MNKGNEQYYVTTPIYYVNAEPHLGHAYTTVVADTVMRYEKFLGKDTFFLTGTDEHGDKIVKAAEAKGITPKEYVDAISAKFRNLLPILGVEPDRFIRTTDPDHVATVQYVLNKVYERGDIVFKEYEGLYCYGCERFYTERELVDGRCPDHGTRPVHLKEENYFFRMSKYQDWLIDHIESNPAFITPERYRNEVLSFLKDPLEDLCISRPKSRLTWGVELPFDTRFVTYVWFDALINYLTGLGFPDDARFRRYWGAANHVIAKDILKPHAIYWPCMLKALGLEPYKGLHVHGYWRMKETKMSKSLGNVVSPEALVNVFGKDPVRYCMLREMAFGLDANFSPDAFFTRINADLANDLGNLASRVFTMVKKYCGAQVPQKHAQNGYHRELEAAMMEAVSRWLGHMDAFEFHRAYAEVWEVLNKANKVIVRSEPWVLARDEKRRDELEAVLYALLEVLRMSAVLISPVMPETSKKLLDALGIGGDTGLDRESISGFGLLEPGQRIKGIKMLFPRLRREDVLEALDGQSQSREVKMEEREKMGEGEAAPMTEEALITIDMFSRVELRVALVKDCVDIEGADRLYRLTVLAPEERTIVAGVKGQIPKEELVGKRIVIVSNLKPVKLRGVESQGMMLVAKDANGLHPLTVDDATEPGAKVS